jgi:hypothetical protein
MKTVRSSFHWLKRRAVATRQRTLRAGQEAGQTLVEFALVLPILLVMIFGLVDFGRAFYTWLLVTNAAREGARTAAVQLSSTQVDAAIIDAMGTLPTSGVLVIQKTNVQGDRGEPVTIELTYDFDYVTPIGALMSLFGGSLAEPTISAESTMRLE